MFSLACTWSYTPVKIPRQHMYHIIYIVIYSQNKSAVICHEDQMQEAFKGKILKTIFGPKTTNKGEL